MEGHLMLDLDTGEEVLHSVYYCSINEKWRFIKYNI
jgi:hypothetical protein